MPEIIDITIEEFMIALVKAYGYEVIGFKEDLENDKARE